MIFASFIAWEEIGLPWSGPEQAILQWAGLF